MARAVLFPDPRKQPLRFWFNLAALVVILALLFLIFFGSSELPGQFKAINHVKKAKTAVELSNLVSMCRMYETTYHFWPTHTQTPPTGDYVLRLKKESPWFVQVMMGYPTPADLQWNTYKIGFANFGETDLTPDPATVTPLDAYGNADLVLIFDADHDGKIAPFSLTLTGKNGKIVTVRQTVPVFTDAIAMSPGQAETDDDIITTWPIWSPMP